MMPITLRPFVVTYSAAPLVENSRYCDRSRDTQEAHADTRSELTVFLIWSESAL